MRSFFGDCDKKGGTQHGKIVNAIPMWTKDKVIADMKDDVRDIEQQEELGLFISAKVRATKKARKAKLENILKQIAASDPRGKVKGKDLDAIAKVTPGFIEKVRKLNPTHHDDDQAIKAGKSNINPTLQGFNSKRPCIKLENELEVEIARSCDMRIDENNMVSRDDMTRGIWLLEPILGIRPNHLRLKYDKPPGYIQKASQVQVGELPSDMTKSNSKKTALAQ